ncbi:MAG: ShlB/FhaC/HecB family hemolysin secretion/activation protein [Smithellaceae bacterium]|nr:ShlB/FhaC/HecB family hemolysin secretion/activation protein [Smithellaceae bacterium]
MAEFLRRGLGIKTIIRRRRCPASRGECLGSRRIPANAVVELVLLSSILIFVSLPGSGRAQVPEAATPGAVEKSIQPAPPREPAPLPEIKVEEARTPLAGGSGVTFPLLSVIFEGNTMFSSERLLKVIAPYMGKTIEVSRLPEIADAITAFYRREGYFLSRAYIPPQRITDDQVTIRIREARLGEISVVGNRRYRSEMIEKTLQIIHDRGAVSSEDVERGLLLLTDYPGLGVKATFKPGEEPGTTDVVVTVTEGGRAHVAVDYDNFGSEFVSRDRYGATVNLDNLSGWGDSLGVRAVTGDYGPDGLFYGRAEYVIPLGYEGTRIGINYTHLKYELQKELGILDAGGEANGGGVWVGYPIVRGRGFNWFMQGGFNIGDESQEVAGEVIGRDKVRYAFVGALFQWNDSLKGRNSIGLRGSQSFAKIFGGMEQGSIDTIRLNTDVIYSKLDVDAMRIQKLSDGFLLLLSGTGQLSGSRLPSSEEFHLGGAGTVRGYAEGERSGDSGLAVTAELRIPLLGLQDRRFFGKTVGEMVQLAAFYDYGKVWISDARENGEDVLDGVEMQGAGVGLRIDYSPTVHFRLDWAKSVGRQNPLNDSGNSDGVWLVQGAIYI